MRNASVEYLETVKGSQQRCVEISSTYAGVETSYNLPIVGGSIEFEEGRDAIRVVDELTVLSEDGKLSPILETDPLAPYGQQIDIAAGAELLNGRKELFRLGSMRIHDAFPKDVFRQEYPGGPMRLSSSTISLQVEDLMMRIVEAKIVTALQPLPGSTCKSEIRRLVGDIMPIGTFAGITDKPAPRGIVYDEDRAANLRMLAELLNCFAYINDAGVFDLRSRVYSNTVVADVHTYLPLQFPTEAGQVVTIERGMTREGVYNQWVARGEADSDKAPIQRYAYDTTTAARWGSDFGYVPYIETSPYNNTVAAAETAAKTGIDANIAGRDQVFTLDILPNDALEILDVVRLWTPIQIVIGRLRRVRHNFEPGGMMNITLTAAPGDIAIVDPEAY